jgi:glycosyltransferase involved in cell wall biosynthesis
VNGPASVIINNYNYARFLRDAIDSALAQTYPDTEVIVVDDGSTDDSREIIATYGERITPILKPNGGQASTFNAALPRSRGRAVFFLDSDDTLLPSAVEEAMARFAGGDVVKVHWRLHVVDESGKPTGHTKPGGELPQGDLRSRLSEAPPDYLFPPQSGNAWTRAFLERVLPIPETEYRTGGADVYLSMLCIMFGRIASLPEPRGTYRVHGASHYTGRGFDERVRAGLRRQDQVYGALARLCAERGIEVDADAWRRSGWFGRLQQVTDEVRALVPAGESIILADGGEWATDPTFAGRPRFNFPDRGGHYWGPPADDAAAVAELERLRQAGAGFIIFGWPTFWWLEYYGGLHRHLRENYRRITGNDRFVAFDLRAGARHA